MHHNQMNTSLTWSQPMMETWIDIHCTTSGTRPAQKSPVQMTEI